MFLLFSQAFIQYSSNFNLTHLCTQSFLSNLFSKQFYFTKHRTIIHSIFYRTCICHWTTDLKPFSICENHIPCIKNFTFIQHTIHPFNSEGFSDMIFKLMKVLLVHTMQKVAMLLWALWWRRNGRFGRILISLLALCQDIS